MVRGQTENELVLLKHGQDLRRRIGSPWEINGERQRLVGVSSWMREGDPLHKRSGYWKCGKASRVLGVEKHAEEEPSGQRFLK